MHDSSGDAAAQPWFATSHFRGNPFAAPISHRVDLIPTASRHTLTVLALSHRMHRLSVHSCYGDAKVLSLRRHEHMAHAISLLRESVATGKASDSFGTITSITMFNKTEVCATGFAYLFFSHTLQLMYSDLVDWRGHIRAFFDLINLRGGLQQVYKMDARIRVVILTVML